MSSSGNPSLPSTVRCSACGHENSVTKQFCVICGNRLQPDPAKPPSPAPPSPAPPSPGVTHDVQSLLDQISSLRSDLAAAEAAAGGHLEKLKASEGKVKDAEAAAVAVAAAHAGKLKEAEDKVRNLELEAIKLAGQVKPWFDTRMKWIAGVITLIGSLSGGFSVGRWALPNDTKAGQVTAAQQETAKVKADLTSATEAGKKVEADLTAQLETANRNVADLTTQLKGQVAQLQQAENRLATAQRDVAAAKTQLGVANGKTQQLADEVTKLTAQQTAINQHSKELESTIQARESEIAALKDRIASLTKPVPRTGTLTWSGWILGKRKIEIKDGAVNYGAISGALPRTPCTVIAEDSAHVELKTLPSAKNQWNQLAFEVSGNGNLQVRINWKASQ